ncbi:MAG TPA: ATP-binding protein, partial [Streptomyces sp.]|nr:ATP-binding protein [Streptomyces sp.]
EEEESDPGRLSTLFKLDHLATRMRRYSENLLLLAGAEHVTSHHSGPVSLLDVLRAAISEIERYERVELGTLPPHAQVSGYAADDLSHLVAELLDNAATFSPPDTEVRLSGWLLESGEVMLSIEDEGIGVTSRRLSALNARLSAPDGQQPPDMAAAADAQSPDRKPEAGLGMGLYVVARLASRHGLRVQLRERKQGGIAAVVAVPRSLLPARPAPLAAPGDGARTPAPSSSAFPGSVAEANSNALPVRRVPSARTETGASDSTPGTSGDETDDPMVAAAEQALRGSEREQHGRAPADGPAGETARPDTGTDPAADTDDGTDRPAVPAAAQAGVEADAALADDAGDAAEDATQPPRLTDKGLPKRTPQQVAAQTATAPPRKQSANAEELRRRLGGFQRGSQHGRRDAAAETGAEENETDQRGAQSDGGTAEEART